jgi:hypothetical protein
MDLDPDHRHPGKDPEKIIPDPQYCFNCKIFRWYVLLLRKIFYGLTGLNKDSNFYILTFCSAGLFPYLFFDFPRMVLFSYLKNVPSAGSLT